MKQSTRVLAIIMLASVFLFMPPVTTVSIELWLNPEDTTLAEATKRAVQEWKRYGEHIGIGAGVQVRWNPELSQNGLPVAAAVYESGKEIEINSTMYRPGVDCLWCAIFHEIGHLLGYEHGGDHYGLEFPNPNGTP